MFKSTLAAMAAVFALSALSPAAMAAKGDPHVLLTTSAGNIELELDKQKAPVSVQNFVDYVNSGFYNNTTFHRVIPGFMIQGGGFTEQMQQKKPNPPIKNEADNGLRNTRGTIAMARTADKDSATSQFFINVADNAFLDHGQRDFGYAVFAIRRKPKRNCVFNGTISISQALRKIEIKMPALRKVKVLLILETGRLK